MVLLCLQQVCMLVTGQRQRVHVIYVQFRVCRTKGFKRDGEGLGEDPEQKHVTSLIGC